MDPLSITASITAITTLFGKSAKSLHHLCTSFGNASLVIATICSETAIITASLSQIQSLMNCRPDAIMTQLQSRPELLTTLDFALTGCMLVSSCLESEVHKLVSSGGEAKPISWGAKARFLWNQDTLKDLLELMRGHQAALSLLIQGLQMESLADVRDLLRDNSKTLERIARRTQSLRSAHRRISQLVPESILTASQPQDRPSEDGFTSTIGSAEFDFDDEVVTSRAYRSAMAAARQKASKRPIEPQNLDVKRLTEIPDEWPDEEPSLNTKRFVGMKCDACEELLEHKWQGERILMTECEHIHHERCLLLHVTLNGRTRTSCPTPSCARVIRMSSGSSVIRGLVPF